MTGGPTAHLRLGGRVGEDRVWLLEAIARCGSISAAGEALGLSYRATWDAVQALNNLFPKPLVKAQAGGRSGGAAALTWEGEMALNTLRHVQAEIALTMERLQRRLQSDPTAIPYLDPWSLVMRTSARNALRGTIEEITEGAVNSEVILAVSDDVQIVTIVSKPSVEALGLKVGSPAVALIKSSFVILMAGAGPFASSARNALTGVVAHIEDGAVNAEVALDIAEGKTLAAIITRESVKALELKPGDTATALIEAGHVILAVE